MEEASTISSIFKKTRVLRSDGIVRERDGVAHRLHYGSEQPDAGTSTSFIVDTSRFLVVLNYSSMDTHYARPSCEGRSAPFLSRGLDIDIPYTKIDEILRIDSDFYDRFVFHLLT